MRFILSALSLFLMFSSPCFSQSSGSSIFDFGQSPLPESSSSKASSSSDSGPPASRSRVNVPDDTSTPHRSVESQIIPPPVMPTTVPARPLSPIEGALDTLMQGKLETAISLSEAIEKSAAGHMTPDLINALHIKAVALAREGQILKASKVMDRVYASGKTNRSIVINCACMDISNGADANRAAKNLSAYSIAHPGDETVVNLLGMAIHSACSIKKTAFLNEQIASYTRANSVLESSRSGVRHWGTRWISSSEYDVIQSQRNNAIAEYTRSKANQDRLQSELDDAQSVYKVNNTTIVGGTRSQREERQSEANSLRDKASQNIKYITPRLNEAMTKTSAAMAAIPLPEWSADLSPIDPVLLDSVH